MRRLALIALCLLVALTAVLLQPVQAKKISDIKNTKHNLSTTGPGTLKSDQETQICVFCHTPHQAENIPNAPLWNRQLSGATYNETNTYSSLSIDADLAELAKGPSGLSKLCLSCHDGTMAIANVNVANGKANPVIPLSNTGPGNTMSTVGLGTGFTRNLGTDMTNDHPISFTYSDTVANADGELRRPSDAPAIVGTRIRGETKPLLPLEGGKMQCTTCHDPHLRDDVDPASKFLRSNRLQVAAPTGAPFSDAGDIVCLACHDKAGQAWAYSAHANPAVATATFNDAAADRREFPRGTEVWRAACLSCHDTHTVPGARRLLREGTDSTPAAGLPKTAGKSAIEETCYQCHTTSGATGESILLNAGSVPNIKTDFTRTYRMPITTADQKTAAVTDSETHNIGAAAANKVAVPRSGADFYEERDLLGYQAGQPPKNRHVECTDCHNPHRVVKNRVFNPANPKVPDDRGTHNHTAGHTNIASGVLRGSYGVEPTYGADKKFNVAPTVFAVKKGLPGTTSEKGDAWVTREYQVCLKCHSRYGYDQQPAFGSSGGGTMPDSTRTGYTSYTDQAMEFHPPPLHKGAASVTDSGAHFGRVRRNCATATTPCGSSGCICSSTNFDFQTRNHRAWHPVMDETGRNLGARGMTSSGWLAPWTNSVGTQTMYCSDCHGSGTTGNTVDPGTAPWGPHGSGNPFILKGIWNQATGSNGKDNSTPTADALCFKCHSSQVYATGSNTSSRATAFYQPNGRGNLHAYHTQRIERMRCTWCHVAVPHGWKNRSLLVNLNDVGPEGGQAVAGTEVPILNTTSFTYGAYYNRAKLKIRSFAQPGNWTDTNCGSATGNGSDTSKTVGKDWMQTSCSSPP